MYAISKKFRDNNNRFGHTCMVLILIIGLPVSLLSQNLNNPNKQGPIGTQVNTISGNLFIPRTDIYVPARGFDLNMTFFYNSFLSQEEHGFGKGWSFGYNIKYINDTATQGNKIIFWGDGREDTYDSVSPGRYNTPVGFFDSLSQYQPGKFLIKNREGVKYYFENGVHKHITKMEEPSGNFIQFTYSDSLLSSLTNNAGQTIRFSYNAKGRLATMTDEIAAPAIIFTYIYDVNGNLVEVKDPLGGRSRYTYLVNGPMKTIADKNNNVADLIYFPDMTVREIIGCNKRMSFSYDTSSNTTVVTDHLETGNQITKYTYDKNDQLYWIKNIKGNCCGLNESYDYDEYGNRVKMKDANGQEYTYTYDGNGNMLTATDPLGQVSTYTYTSDFNKIKTYKDPKGYLYTLSYDAHGNMTQLIMPGNNIYAATYNTTGNIITSTDPKGNVYTYNYDALGNPTNVTGPEGYTAALSFNARGNLLSYTDARGNNSSAEYDILNRLKKITDPVNNNTQLNYDAAGNMVSYKNKNNETNWRSYDASNRLVKIKGPTGNEFNYTYDGMDNLLSVKDPLGFENKFIFDNRNRVISAFDAENNSTGYTYDNNGNVTSKRLPNGQTFFYTHDNLNRLILIKDQTGDIAKFSYDPNGNPTRFENGTGAIITATYDSLNRLKSETDALGNSITYAYDKNSNLIAVTDQEGKTSNFTYDNKDRLHTYTDNNAAVITLGYDAANNITSRKDQNNNTTTYLYDELNRRKRMTYPDGKYNEYNYDSKGNVISVRLTDGTAILYQYDTLKRLIRRTLPGGEQYNFTYDKLNRVISATNNNGTVNVSYDGLNRIISESFDGRTVNYTYSISGRTKSTVYPDGSVVKKEFDTRGRLVKIFKDNIPVVEYAYNNANQLTAKSFANNVSSLLQYDYANRLSNLNTSSGTIQNSNFTYNKTYNKTAVNRLNDPTGSETFNYDNGYRLTNYKKGPPGSPVVQNTYTYDAVGNRTAANLGGAAKTYSINNLNQLTAVNGTVFTFDNRGNLAYDGSSYKTYDAENRLLKDSASPLRVIAYSYDAFGRRITKNINGSILKYTYSGASQIEERDGANTLRNKTVFNDFLSPVINEKNGQTFYYHANESGSVEAITNSNGRLIEKYSYDAYGKMSRFDSLNNPLSSSIAGNRFGFTGQEYDSASGSYRFFFRNYSPETGVFNQRDLIEYEDGMGMYQYVGNNPANGIDIWGLAASDDCIEGEKGIDLRNTWILPLPFDEMARKVGDIQHSQTKSEKIHNQVELFDQVGEAGIKMVVANVVSQLANGKYVLQNVFSVLGQGASQIAAGGPVGAVSAGATTTVAAGVAIGLPVGFYGLHVYKEGMEIDNNISNTEVYNYMLTHGKEGEGYERYLKLKHLEEMTRERDRLNKNPCPPQGGTRKKYRLFWDPKTKMWVLRPIDPNLIIGPDGEPGKKWVPLPDRMPYTVLFENDSSATAPAKFVRISTTIHPKHDPATFELGSVGFNNQSFDIPAGTASYYTRLDCRDSLNLFVDLTAGYDQITHQAFWEFQSIDPLTLLPTEDPLAGFVMLQDSLNPLYGNGFVNYSIKPAASAHTLDTVTAQASITFDQNAAIATNVHSNTIDAVAPMSSITALIPFTPDTEVPLHYTGADDNNGSGLRSYSIFVSDNSGTPQLYVQDFTKADTVFRGLANHTYRFYAAAKDTAGNIETLRPLDSIRITNGEFVICPNGNVNFDSKMTGSSFQWQVDNGTGYTNIVNGGIYSGGTTPVLQIITAPSTTYGFKYRCLANGTTYSLQFVLKFGMTWEGNTSESWENPANWSCGSLPDQNTDVTIDAAKTNYPKVNSNVIIRTLRLNNGSTGTVNTGYNFTILK